VFVVDADSSQWVEIRSEISTAQVGLVPVVPASVSVGVGTASVNASGTVSFVNANDVNLNGIFTTAYKYYHISFQYQGSAGGGFNLFGLFTNNGTNVTNSYYGTSFYSNYTSGSGIDIPRNNGSNMLIGSTGQEGEAHTDMQVSWNPGSSYISMKYTNYNLSIAQNLWGGYNAGKAITNWLRMSTASSRTITGTVRIYGYN
jgi:hypothetical protein